MRAGLPRRPGPSGIAAHDKVILSDHDLAVIRKAVALARNEGEDYRQQSSAAGERGIGPAPDAPAPGPRESRPPESRSSAPPPAITQALPAAGPSWGTLLANTIRTWARQRSWTASTRWRVTIALILAAMVLWGGAVAVVLVRGTTAGSGVADRTEPTGPGLAGTGPASGEPPPGDTEIAGAAAARTAAAAWIARQVDPAAIIACDPLMCAVLQSTGIPAGRLLLLGPASVGPLGSDVIVSTAVVRAEFGSRLTGVYAPVTLATFGSGSARVAVRVVAADGSAAYQRSLQADAAARRSVGALLLSNPDVRVSPAGRRELAAGQIDARLLTVIGALATPYQVDITDFGAPAAGASPAVPLRSADISITPAGNGRDAAALDSAKGFLLAQQAPFRPADVTTVRLAGGQPALHIEFTAPSPLGLLGTPA